MKPRGVRLNNPGNIRKGEKWQGLSPEQPDSEFCSFITPSYGIRAMARLLINYQDKYNLRTITEIISKWAPTSENDTNAYIYFVCSKSGFSKDQVLDMHSYEHIEPVIRSMISMEQGMQPYTKAQIIKGLVMAGVEPPDEGVVKSRTVKGATVVTGAALASPWLDNIDKIAPAIPLVERLAQYMPAAISIVIVLAAGYILWARIDDKRKGLR